MKGFQLLFPSLRQNLWNIVSFTLSSFTPLQITASELPIGWDMPDWQTIRYEWCGAQLCLQDAIFTMYASHALLPLDLFGDNLGL